MVLCECASCTLYDHDPRMEEFDLTASGASYVDEMNDPRFTAADYYRLLAFVRDGKHDPVLTAVREEVSHGSEGEVQPTTIRPFSSYPADIILQSSDEQVIEAHRVVLHMASADAIVGKAEEEGCARNDLGVPIVKLEEDGPTLGMMLELIYPCGEEYMMGAGFNDMFKVWLAVRKYGMGAAEKAARKIWMKSVERSPLRVYFTAIRNGWKDEARLAAQQLTQQIISDLFVEEMETSPVNVYHNLLKYHHQYLKAIATHSGTLAVVNNETPGTYAMIAAPVIKQRMNANYKLARYLSLDQLVEETKALENKMKDTFSEVTLEINEELIR